MGFDRKTISLLATLMLALLSGCDPVYYIKRTSDALPRIDQLQCIERAIETVPSVVFKKRSTWQDNQYFGYTFMGLPEGANHGVVQIHGRTYTNELVTRWKSEADLVRLKVEPILIQIDAAVMDTCKIKFETKQSG